MGYNAINSVFDTLADLSSQAGSANIIAYVRGGTTMNDGNGGNYLWDENSTATHDGIKIIKVTDVTTGRWMRATSNVYKTGQVTFSGITLQTTYTVAHGLAFTPSSIHIQARSAGAASTFSHVGVITGTNFQIIFTGIPALGVNNITYDFFAIR